MTYDFQYRFQYRAVLLCTEQGTALRGHREQDSSNDVGKISDTERAIQR